MNLTFGEAIEAVKLGHSIQRAGWNGKGMYVFLNKGSVSVDLWDTMQSFGGVSSAHFEVGDKDTLVRMPNLNMKAADGSIVTGWLASQTDILAEDWQIVN